jgi:carbamoyl-phosphate synthase large subunit
MRIVYNDEDLLLVMVELLKEGSLGREGGLSAERPVLIDRFLEDVVEVDVDAIRDATGDFVIGGVMEHVEEAGVHSGDSACVLPPPTLSEAVITTIEANVRAIAERLDVRGLINVQFAVVGEQNTGAVVGGEQTTGAVIGQTTDAFASADGGVYVIEANPRASRTVPFVAKATGVPLAKVAARVQAGETLADLRTKGILNDPVDGGYVSVKAPVLPFDRFPEADTLLLPEMRSTGEAMGIDSTFGMAFAKSQLAAKNKLPDSGTVFMSLADRDKEAALPAAIHFLEMGFTIAATEGTARFLQDHGLQVHTVVAKVGEQTGTDATTLIESGEVQLVVNTPREGRAPRADGDHIRAAAHKHNIPCVTTAAAARAVAGGIAAWRSRALKVRSLQELHANEQMRLSV